jgi:Flp pilus assembly protein TadG
MKPGTIFTKEQKGQSIVEFSLMLPVFLLIMMFIIEICFGVYYKIVINQILLDVARVVAVSDNETITQTNNKVQAILDAYQSHGAIFIRTKDTSLFSVSWTTQTIDIIYKVITVKARYTGLRLPFMGTLPVSDQIIFPYVEAGSGI